MKHRTEVVVIGLGSAGLSAVSEIKRVTDDFLLVQSGLLGTSCARSACMPTKTFLEVADLYHRRTEMSERGITGSGGLGVNLPHVMTYVRTLRDRFVGGMVDSTERYRGRIIEGRPVFETPDTLRVGDDLIEAGRIVIATGSSPVIPGDWERYRDLLLTTDEMIEQEDLPPRLAVIGLGPAGLEYAQGLSRLGIEVIGFDASSRLAGLSDPQVNEGLIGIMRQEFGVIVNGDVELQRAGDELVVRGGGREERVEKALLAVGRKPNLDGLGLEKLGLLDGDGVLLDFSEQTMQLGDAPIFIAGDVNDRLPILHEAIDDGHIAGFNAARSAAPHCFGRRVPLRIVFTEPGVAMVGSRFETLAQEEIVIGSYDFGGQARARMSGRNAGLLRLYAAGESGRLLGAEMAAPQAEHLAHFLALAIDRQMSVFELLKVPFYHPTLEEGVRGALREAGKAASCTWRETELMLCRSTAEETLC